MIRECPTAGPVKGCFTTQMIWSRLIRSFWNESEYDPSKDGVRGCTTTIQEYPFKIKKDGWELLVDVINPSQVNLLRLVVPWLYIMSVYAVLVCMCEEREKVGRGDYFYFIGKLQNIPPFPDPFLQFYIFQKQRKNGQFFKILVKAVSSLGIL